MRLIFDIIHSVLRKCPTLRSSVKEKASASLIRLISKLG